MENSNPIAPEDGVPRLDVIVGGAGIGGLACAIAMAQHGHRVTVFEMSQTIGAHVGAGIQVAPNMSRLLSRLGVMVELEKKAIHPESISFRRWDNGGVIGQMKTANFREKYGSPYVQVHRGDLHAALYARAQEVGVRFRVNAAIEDYDIDEPSMRLMTGDVVPADLVVSADGKRGRFYQLGSAVSDAATSRPGIGSNALRQTFEARNVQPVVQAEFDAYRCTVPVSQLLADAKTKWLVERPFQNIWYGPDQHMVAYAVNENKLYNMVWVVPHECESDLLSDLDFLKQRFAGWDPRLNHLLDMVESCDKWPIKCVLHLEHMVVPSGKFVVIGDAAHDMTPFLAQGSAMAIEDASLLGKLTANITDPSELPSVLQRFERTRLPRTSCMREEALRNLHLWHLPDGVLQQKRDRDSIAQMSSDGTATSPYILTHPKGQRWLYAYDVEAQTDEASYRSQWPDN